MGDLDRRAFLFFYGGDGHTPAVFFLMIGLTVLGSGWSMVGLLPLFAPTRTRLYAAWLLGTFLATALLVHLLKMAVGRARPCTALAGVHALFGSPTDFSFPSGHAAGAFAFAGFVVAIALSGDRGGRGVRRMAAAGALVLACGIAASRVYLGCHFPGDALAGAILGGIVGTAGGRLCRAEL